MKGQDSDKEQISWLESKEDETEVQESTEKGKQREQRLDGAEKEGQVERQEDENAMEGVEKRSSGCSLVAYSVGTGARQIYFEIF